MVLTALAVFSAEPGMAGPPHGRPALGLGLAVGTINSPGADAVLADVLSSHGEFQSVSGDQNLRLLFSASVEWNLPVCGPLTIVPAFDGGCAPKFIETGQGKISVYLWHLTPGISGALDFGHIRLRAGRFRFHSRISVDDPILNLNETWHGSETGWEYGLELRASGRTTGVGLEVLYRDAKIRELQTDRGARLAVRGEPIEIQLTGWELRMAFNVGL